MDKLQKVKFSRNILSGLFLAASIILIPFSMITIPNIFMVPQEILNNEGNALSVGILIIWICLFIVFIISNQLLIKKQNKIEEKEVETETTTI